MNTVRLVLSTKYDDRPSHIRIQCCGEVIFQDLITKDLDISHQISDFKKFNIEIDKIGKDKDLVDKKSDQEVTVNQVTLNGIDLKIEEFGKFFATENFYMNDQLLQTNKLFLNGKWIFELPARDLSGGVCEESWKVMKDKFIDCDIACFGCSQTYGALLEQNQSWPSQLEILTKKSVMNYGVPGSNINEIMALIENYLKDYSAENVLIYLPHTFRRQEIVNGKLTNIGSRDDKNKELILHGEEHSVASISGDLCSWFDKISRETNISFSSYHRDEFDLFQKTNLKKYMFPYLENDDYPKAKDGAHSGPEFNQDLAKIIQNFL